MSMRSILVLVLAVVFGGTAAVIVSRVLSAPAAGLVETVPVVAAKVEIPRGSVVSADMVEIRNWPKQMVPEKVITDIDDAVKRTTLIHMLPGDLVLDSKLADKDAGRGLATLIPDGMRAYTIQTSKVASNVAGFVLPGNRVDVLLTLKGQMQDETGGGASTTLLQAVEILAVDQELDGPSSTKTADARVDLRADLRSVTLLVAPKQAAFLDLGQNMGQLTLSLRNPGDITQTQSVPSTVADLLMLQDRRPKKFERLFGASEKPSAMSAPVDPAPPQLRIRTLRGTRAGEVVVSFDK